MSRQVQFPSSIKYLAFASFCIANQSAIAQNSSGQTARQTSPPQRRSINICTHLPASISTKRVQLLDLLLSLFLHPDNAQLCARVAHKTIKRPKRIVNVRRFRFVSSGSVQRTWKCTSGAFGTHQIAPTQLRAREGVRLSERK